MLLCGSEDEVVNYSEWLPLSEEVVSISVSIKLEHIPVFEQGVEHGQDRREDCLFQMKM